jgi:hypothetical protein
LRHTAAIVCGCALVSAAAGAAERCETAAALPEVRAALARIAASVDPCGETAELAGVVERFRRCAAGARLCLDSAAPRNVTEARGELTPTTIVWNPTLRTALEASCAGGDGPLRRDPTASLLHEMVHAVQDCDGLDISALELEAVRVENIYRRAQGLCQRTAYGSDPLPAARRIACAPGDCPCTPADRLPARGMAVAVSAEPGAPAAGDARE